MNGEIAVVFDTSALLAYVAGEVAVGELLAEVADEGRQAGVPAACLAAAHAATATALGHAARAAIVHRAHLATTDPKTVAPALPAGWSILDLSQA